MQSEIEINQRQTLENLAQLTTKLTANLNTLESDAQTQKEGIIQKLAAITPQQIVGEAIAEMQQDVSSVREQLANLKANHPQLFLDPGDFVKQGNDLFAQEKYEEAIALYDRALELKADYPDAWFHRALALKELSRYEGTIAALNKVLKMQSDRAEAWFYRGVTLNRLKRYQEATAAYDRAVEIDPEYYQAWVDRGVAFGMLLQHEEAYQSFDRAVQIKPDKSVAWMTRGMAVDMLERYDEAIASFDRAVELDPGLFKAWNYRNRILIQLEKYDEAIASCDRSLALKADYAPAYYSKAICYAAKKEVQLAVENLQKAIEINNKYRKEARIDRSFDGIAGEDLFWQLVEQED